MSEIDRLVALGDANAILDELQQRTTEWDDAREALDRLIDGSAQVIAAADVDRAGIVRERDALRGEVVRLRGQLGMHLTAWRNARDRARLWRGRAVRAYTTLAEARQEAEKARADAANQREFARDGHAIAEQASALHRDARAEVEQVHAALDMARGRLEECKAHAARYYLAWLAARRGRAEARAEVKALKETVAAADAERDRLEADRDRIRGERDRRDERVQRVRALHREVCGGACGLDDSCDCTYGQCVCDECGSPYPCDTRRALDGEPGA